MALYMAFNGNKMHFNGNKMYYMEKEITCLITW